MSQDTTTAKKPRAHLTHEQYFLLRDWTEKNTNLIVDRTNVDHANMAQEALGFSVSPSTIKDLRQALGIIRPEPEKEPELADVINQLGTLQERVTTLVNRVTTLEDRINLPPHILNKPAVETGTVRELFGPPAMSDDAESSLPLD